MVEQRGVTQFQALRHRPGGAPSGWNGRRFADRHKTADDQAHPKAVFELVLQTLRLLAFQLQAPFALRHAGRAQQGHFIEAGNGDQRIALGGLQLRQQLAQQVRLRLCSSTIHTMRARRRSNPRYAAIASSDALFGCGCSSWFASSSR